MQLYCRNGVVLAWHDDGQSVPASAYGAGVTVMPWSQPIGTLGRVGDPPSEGEPDARPYAAPAITPDTLAAYANTKQWALATGGLTLTLSGQSVKVATDDDSRTAIAGKYLRMAQPGAPTTIAWQVGPRSFVTISAADFATVAVKVADFVQATFDALAVVLAAITGGTITTTAQVDAAAWPAATA